MNDLKGPHRAYQRKYARLVEAVSQAVDRADSIGLLAMGCPADEYGPEAGTSIPRLKTAENAQDVRAISASAIPSSSASSLCSGVSGLNGRTATVRAGRCGSSGTDRAAAAGFDEWPTTLGAVAAERFLALSVLEPFHHREVPPAHW